MGGHDPLESCARLLISLLAPFVIFPGCRWLWEFVCGIFPGPGPLTAMGQAVMQADHEPGRQNTEPHHRQSPCNELSLQPSHLNGEIVHDLPERVVLCSTTPLHQHQFCSCRGVSRPWPRPMQSGQRSSSASGGAATPEPKPSTLDAVRNLGGHAIERAWNTLSGTEREIMQLGRMARPRH
jgi:hypothetical protein